MSKRTVVALCAACLWASSLSQAIAAPNVAFDQNLNATLPADVVMRNAKGEPVALGDYFGKQPVILMPVYYRCPMLCGVELNGLVRCLRGMDMTAGDQFHIVTFSIDPREGPELALQKQKQYLAQYGRKAAGDGWDFLTGDQADIDRLTQAIGFRSEFNPENGQYAHAAGIVVCTADGRIARYLYGVDFAPRDLQLALVEASQNRIGTLADHILLYCYMYDATTGKYGLAILRLVRTAGCLTLFSMVAGIVWMLRHDKNSGRRHNRGDTTADGEP